MSGQLGAAGCRYCSSTASRLQRASAVWTRWSCLILYALMNMQELLPVGAATFRFSYEENAFDAIPSFVVIGTAKAGTTDLYAQLVDEAVSRDPARPEPPIVQSHHKESNFFTSINIEDFAHIAPGAPRYMKYLQHLNHPCANTTDTTVDGISTCLHVKGMTRFTIDATPTYIASSVAPLALASLSPRTKVIAMLRDPIERAQMLFRHFVIDKALWTRQSIDSLSDGFFAFLEQRPDISAGLAGLRDCAAADTACLAAGWHAVSVAGLVGGSEESKLFAGGLYTYALAAWRERFLQPGRFMLIDAHAYFRDRSQVMEQVVYFMYGRSMTAAERAAAGAVTFWRKGVSDTSAVGQKWVLSGPQRARLAAFYSEHVTRGLGGLLGELRGGGAHVVGFDGPPWTQPPSRASRV